MTGESHAAVRHININVRHLQLSLCGVVWCGMVATFGAEALKALCQCLSHKINSTWHWLDEDKRASERAVRRLLLLGLWVADALRNGGPLAALYP